MYQLLMVLHVIIALMIIGLVLLQHGKGADIGAAFGSGAANTVFGSQGSGGFLFKLTFGLALAFFTTSLLLSTIVSRSNPGIPKAALVQDKKFGLPLPVEEKKQQQKHE